MLKGLVLSLHVSKFGLLFNLHNPSPLVSVNSESLCLSLRLVNLLNCLGLDLLYDDVTVTLSINDLLVGLSLSIEENLLVRSLRLLLLLRLLDDSSLDLLF